MGCVLAAWLLTPAVIYSDSADSAARGGVARQARGADLQSELRLSFLEACNGCVKSIVYTVDEACEPCRATGKVQGGKKKHCSACSGRGYSPVMVQHGIRVRMECEQCGGEGRLTPLCPSCKGAGVVAAHRQLDVRIPAGVSENTNVRLLQMGDAGRRGGRRGNLRIRIRVDEDEAPSRRRREGNDVHSELCISLPAACLGGEHTVETVDGQQQTVTLQSGVQPGHRVVLKGRGVRALNSSEGQRGDHVLHVSVRIPQQAEMSPQQIDMMKTWSAQQHHSSSSEPKQQQQQAEAEQADEDAEAQVRLSTSKAYAADSKKSKKKGKKVKAGRVKQQSRRRREAEEWEQQQQQRQRAAAGGRSAEADGEEDEDEDGEEDDEEDGDYALYDEDDAQQQRGREEGGGEDDVDVLRMRAARAAYRNRKQRYTS